MAAELDDALDRLEWACVYRDIADEDDTAAKAAAAELRRVQDYLDHPAMNVSRVADELWKMKLDADEVRA